ncbi:hypothetical protein OC834_004234 [Tilletia horrida]|uniref:Mitochondrial import inner membrane translocase subunit Tim21 n=1 Tax=Tilletia horrida TaxID=155126 RepID=A0AAN6JJB2_9BASI|nr:hypothetical protein OC834_004234 [Tilletia horrida]KAK0528841.1 hypothetical protein OC842_004422 [Tilletia horrida]
MSTPARTAAAAAALRSSHAPRPRLSLSTCAFSTTSCSAAKELDPAAAAASQTAAEQRRILDDLRASRPAGPSTSKSVFGPAKRKTVDDWILEGETLRRAQSRPSGLAAAGALGTAEDGRPSLLDKITAEGKPWKELGTGQKVARGTRYSTRILLVFSGGALALAIIYTLGTELFAPNSPTVIYADAIRRVKRHDGTFHILLEPLRFLTHPPRNDLTDPSETLLPLPANARSDLRAHKPLAAYSVDRTTGREVMQLHFWIIGRERGTELGWFEEARGWVAHHLLQMSARLQEAWDQAVGTGDGMLAGAAADSAAESRNRLAADEDGATHGQQSSSLASYVAAPFRAVGSLFGAVTRPVTEVGLGSGDARWRFGRSSEPGTFTTAEVVAELEKDDAGVFQYRSLFLRIPHDGIMAQRVWIIRKKGEVVR